jgi:hypothetical protein
MSRIYSECAIDKILESVDYFRYRGNTHDVDIGSTLRYFTPSTL